MMMDDAELLQQYADTNDESAFSDLVSRNIDFVWSTAFRSCKDADFAKDISQDVFADLARKAKPLSSNPKFILAGWLYRATRHASSKMIRSHVRRINREQEAFMMQDIFESTENTDEQTKAILPEIDNAFDLLKPADRNAVILRFLKRKSLKEVGAELSISEEAARKKVSRALEKLRSHLQRKGIKTAVGSLVATLTGVGAQAAPVGIAAIITTSSIAAVGGVGATSGILGILAHFKTQLIIMKTKIGIAAIATAVVITPLAVQQSKLNDLREENLNLQTIVAQLDDLEEENLRLNLVRFDAEELERRREDQEELIALRSEAVQLRQDETDSGEKRLALQEEFKTAELVALEAENEANLVQAEVDFRELDTNTKEAMKQLGLAARLFAFFNEDRLPTTFEEIENELPDEFRGGLKLDRFEYVEHARPISDMEPGMILFREKAARRIPNGSWVRSYAMIDGSVQNVVSEDANFEEWESSHIAHEDPRP